MENAIGALGGVILGGVIAAATNAYFAWRAERDRRLGAAFSLFFKYFAMVDVTTRICRDLDAAPPDRDRLCWPRLRPLAGVRFPESSFSPEELALFAKEKGPLFAEKLLEATNHIHLLSDLLVRYNLERRALDEELRLRGVVDMEGPVGHISVEPATYRELAPKFFEVDDLARNLWSAAHEAKEEMVATANAIGPKLKTILSDKRFHLGMGADLPPQRDGSATRAPNSSTNSD